ncbi:epoxyqueuosine reductase [candidate division WOR-3 bacterium]|nr:epoxyqueuosine reductase [candidate division WOR-3 bacterium]
MTQNKCLTKDSKADFLKKLAQDVNLDGIGFTGADPVEEGFCAKILYDGQYLPSDKFHNPLLVKEWAKSLVVGILSYDTKEKIELIGGEGRIAKYAWGNYYDLLKQKLRMISEIYSRVTGDRVSKSFSNGPLDEKLYAYRAGLGFKGKNGLLVNGVYGTRVVIGLFLTESELPLSVIPENLCLDCDNCLQKCPTKCIKSQGTEGAVNLDRTKCIQELSQRDTVIPENIKKVWKDRFYGCDDCQDSCVLNIKAPPSIHRPSKGWIGGKVKVLDFLENPVEYRKLCFSGSQLNARWLRENALVRNAFLVLAYQKEKRGVPLAKKYENSSSEGVRDAVKYFLSFV